MIHLGTGGIDRLLKLRMSSEHREIGHLAREDEWTDNVVPPADQGERQTTEEREQVPIVEKCSFKVFPVFFLGVLRDTAT